MEKTRIIVAGHHFSFSPFTLYDSSYYFAETATLKFKMALVDGELKLINPDELPEWLIELEERLSDAIFLRNK